jgi:hypothetical protein
MVRRERRQRPPGVGCSLRAFCYGQRFFLASCWVACLYLTHVLWLMDRYTHHDVIRNPPSVIPRHPSLEKIQRRRSEKEMSYVNMEDDGIHIVFSTGCNAYQDCTFLFCFVD